MWKVFLIVVNTQVGTIEYSSDALDHPNVCGFLANQYNMDESQPDHMYATCVKQKQRPTTFEEAQGEQL
jgi:hypothetical protein